jgi:hypothetical protein
MFQKQGSPQPMHVSSCLCEICKSKPATRMVNGKMICDDCSKEIDPQE